MPGLGELADQFAQREPSVRLQRFRGTCGGGLVGAFPDETNHKLAIETPEQLVSRGSP